MTVTLNRSAIVVKPKQRFLDWLHAADPTSGRLTLSILTREPTIYLIPECDTEEDVTNVLRELCEEIFREGAGPAFPSTLLLRLPHPCLSRFWTDRVGIFCPTSQTSTSIHFTPPPPIAGFDGWE